MVSSSAPAPSSHWRRVNAVFAGQWPESTPICEQVVPSSFASELLGRPAATGSSYLRYQAALAWLQGENAFAEFVEQVYQDCLAVHRCLDLDVLFLGRVGYGGPTRQLDEYRFLYGDPDGDDWTIQKLDPESQQFGVVEQARGPLTADEVVQVMRETVAVGPPAEGRVAPILARAQREAGAEFVVGGDSFMSIPMQPGWLEALLLEPGLTADYLDVVVENNLRSMAAQRALGIRFFNGGGDFAFNSGPIYSPRFFETVMAPRWQRLFDWCRAHDAWYVFRSDGNLWPVADSLFGRGRPQAYYEIDTDAGMGLGRLRAAFPELVLIGSISCDLLRRGTPAQVREQTLACLEAAAPRCIIASANSILHGVPVANAMAMYDTARQWRPTNSGD